MEVTKTTKMVGALKRPPISKDRKIQNFPQRKLNTMGKKPLPEPTTVQHVFLMIIMHVCRRIVLFESEIKICVYLAALICGSLVCDFIPPPRTYFSSKHNILNVYFVKWGWFWTMVAVGAYVGLTSYIYCCGNIEKVKSHFHRLLIATLMWFCCTKFFVLFESYTVGCLNTKFRIKEACIENGSIWKGFDISGHAFLLIFCSLVIAEEAKSICGWERIGDLIRNEEFDEESPLKALSDSELDHLKLNYDKFTPYVRIAFMGLTVFSMLWDVMLIATIMYFHTMVQKVMGGSVAILVWYFTYKWWFQHRSSFFTPGQGSFKYMDQPMLRKSCLLLS